MKKEYFYVKPDDSLPPKLPEDLIYTIKIDDINSLALFATTLEPEPETTESFGYASALYTYFQNHKDINNFNDCYKKITSSSWGNQFLCTTISLFLLEKELRTNGIKEELITKYNNMAMDYQKQIEFSKELCGINFKQK